MSTNENNDEQLTLIVDCEHRNQLLTDWERKFISTLHDRVDDGIPLSIRQDELLNEIWDRVTTKGCKL